VVQSAESLPRCGPVRRQLIGFNLPAGHTLEQTRTSALAPPGTNRVFEALQRLRPGLVRVWTSAHECGLDTMQLPPQGENETWEHWLARELADDSPHWQRLDQHLGRVVKLGDETQLLLCLPAFPPWLGPFRAPAEECEMKELRDLRTGERVPYGALLDWCGIRDRCIVDEERFARFAPRVALFTKRLISHCLSQPALRERLAYVSLGNEPDNEAKLPRAVCWRMWVYGPDSKRKMAAKQALSLRDEGLLQQIYGRVHTGLRAADPDRRIQLGGPESAWSHGQVFSLGAYYYLGYFLDGGRFFLPDVPAAVGGVGRETVDFLSYHSYTFGAAEKFQHDRIVNRLFRAFGKPVMLTEYNATAAGHGCNFMQSGATAVADAVVRLGRSPAARGAAFFKGAGGGFGLVLNRQNGEFWRTGAYWTMDLCSRWIVGGQPVRMTPAGTWELDGLAVRFPDRSVRLLFLNRSDVARTFAVSAPGTAASAEARFVELPLAKRRGDYRDVREEEIRITHLDRAGLQRITLAPRGVLFLRFEAP